MGREISGTLTGVERRGVLRSRISASLSCSAALSRTDKNFPLHVGPSTTTNLHSS